MSTLHPVELAARAAGTKARLAKLVGVSPQAITKWLKSGVPAERVLAVERETGVSRHVLRPDIYPSEPSLPRAA